MTNKNCHTRKIARVADWRSPRRPALLLACRGIYWPDRVVALFLEAVREKESLWNTKSEAYKNRNVKKKTVRGGTAGDKRRFARR